MKKLKGIHAFILIPVFLVGTCFVSCKPGSRGNGKKGGEVPAEVANLFREDASRLAVRDLQTSGHSGGDQEGVIPAEMVEKYYNALCKIYQISKKIDSIPDLGQIHTLRRPDLKLIRVRLNDEASFKQNWSKGTTLSSDLYLNNLIGKHKIVIKEYKESPAGPMVLLESPNFVNTPELAMMLSHVKGIDSAEPDAVAGDGNNIESGSDGKNAIAIKFSIGKGDCPSGCIHRKYWIFHLLQDNSVMFIGTKGSLPQGE